MNTERAAEETTVFQGLEDQKPLTPAEAQADLLDSAKRGFVPIRNDFVQRPEQGKPRASLLAKFVTGRQERALDAFLLLHALQPVLGDPLSNGTWAHLLSVRGVCSPSTASKTFKVLEEMNLARRHHEKHRVIITPLLEDGSGREWVKPRSRDDDTSAYFVVPHAYWTSGYAEKLRLPGKAMLLIMLKETQVNPAFSMSVEKAPEWYGISERTAERGYRELGTLGLIQTHIQKVASSRLPAGVMRSVYHRALRGAFSTDTRKQLQARSKERTRTQAAVTTKDA